MSFPPLPLSRWRPTRDTLQAYTRIIARVRQNLTPPQRHWQHASLRTSAVGLTTTPIPAGARTFDLEMNFFTHEVYVRTSSGDVDMISLEGQSAREFGEELVEILATFGIDAKLEKEYYTSEAEGVYDDSHVEAYWQALLQIDVIFKKFAKGLRQPTGAVQFFPHHFDHAVLWFSGRLVPDQDPENEEYSDEQMNFGFSTGDESIPDPYLYITAYPLPAGLIDVALPETAYWHTSGFTGAILPYATLVDAAAPAELLHTFLKTVQQAGAERMIG